MPKEEKRTPWFPVHVNDLSPVRIGEYEYRRWGEARVEKRYWTGKRWLQPDHSVFIAMRGDEWRGILKEEVKETTVLKCWGCGHNFYNDSPVLNGLCFWCVEERTNENGLVDTKDYYTTPEEFDEYE